VSSISTIVPPTAACPHCGENVAHAFQAGHEYCPQCGFEFIKCRHCDANVWNEVRAAESCCRQCGKQLHPDPTRLPDDDFWHSGWGRTVRALTFVFLLGSASAMIFVIFEFVRGLLRER